MSGPRSYPPQNIQDRTFHFGVRVIKLVDRLPRRMGTEVVARQLARSGTSIGANLREADGAESHDDFVHKVKVARKEALESHFWLKLIHETVAQNDSEVIALLDEVEQLGKILYAIANSKKKP
jgi:four helix bundle protein